MGPCAWCCRELCAIVSSSAILVCDFADAVAGGALLFSPLIWPAVVVHAPADLIIPAYGCCLLLLAGLSLLGVGLRSAGALAAATILALVCLVVEFTLGLIAAADADAVAARGLIIPLKWALLLIAVSARHGVRAGAAGALGRARAAFDELRARAASREEGERREQLSERLLERRAERSQLRATMEHKYFGGPAPDALPREDPAETDASEPAAPRRWWAPWRRKDEAASDAKETTQELPGIITRSGGGRNSFSSGGGGRNPFSGGGDRDADTLPSWAADPDEPAAFETADGRSFEC